MAGSTPLSSQLLSFRSHKWGMPVRPVLALGGILLTSLLSLCLWEDSVVQMYNHKVVTQTGSLELELPWRRAYLYLGNHFLKSSLLGDNKDRLVGNIGGSVWEENKVATFSRMLSCKRHHAVYLL